MNKVIFMINKLLLIELSTLSIIHCSKGKKDRLVRGTTRSPRAAEQRAARVETIVTCAHKSWR